jgi:hypothetical protein
MDLKEAIEVLKNYNLWRRGSDEIPMPKPIKIGEAIDVVIKEVKGKNIEFFEEALQIKLNELPYTKHLDDGQYNDGQLYGFELGARWAYENHKQR